MFHASKNMYQLVASNHVSQKKKLTLCACSMTLLLVSLATLSCIVQKPQKANPKPFPPHTISKAVTSACKHTLYQQTCISSLSASPSQSPSALFRHSVQLAIDTAHSALTRASTATLTTQTASRHLPTAIDDCTELLNDSVYRLSAVLNSKGNSSHEDIQTWLSSAQTSQVTCLDSLENVGPSSALENDLMEKANNLSQMISNSLAIHKVMMNRKEVGELHGRRLMVDGFPTWVSEGDRRLLEMPVAELRPHAVVAKDGTGTHESIMAAIAATADGGGGGRTVIHVKGGTYSEGDIPKERSNVMLVGDGKGVTVITGKKSARSGYSTFGSASFGVSGDGFIARDISFVNTAGPSGVQAVALRISSDKSVIYHCALDGYQDTLYSLANRQFFRETDISGTIDFIFGNAAAVFQSCNIAAKGRGYITAQGRSDPNQNTGFSIQNSRVSGGSGASTYLGRPWKKYSRTVFMQSSLDGSIDKAGWYPWSGNFALSTLFYGEYMNTGPGAPTSGRVGWSGYHPQLTPSQASEFTVAQLISGNQWLPSTGVPFDGGL